MVLDQTYACARLDERLARSLRLVELGGENLVFRKRTVVGNGFVKIDILAGFPGGQDFGANLEKFVVGPSFIFDFEFHPLLTPFSLF